MPPENNTADELIIIWWETYTDSDTQKAVRKLICLFNSLNLWLLVMTATGSYFKWLKKNTSNFHQGDSYGQQRCPKQVWGKILKNFSNDVARLKGPSIKPSLQQGMLTSLTEEQNSYGILRPQHIHQVYTATCTLSIWGKTRMWALHVYKMFLEQANKRNNKICL